MSPSRTSKRPKNQREIIDSPYSLLSRNSSAKIKQLRHDICSSQECLSYTRFTHKGQFFIITSVIIIMVLFAVGQVFVNEPFSETDITGNVFEFNSVVHVFERFVEENASLSLKKETTLFLQEYYSRRGFLLEMNLVRDCVEIHMVSRQIDARRKICS